VVHFYTLGSKKSMDEGTQHRNVKIQTDVCAALVWRSGTSVPYAP